MSLELLGPLLAAAPPRANRFYGVTVGIVTNNQDPDGQGRVKVRFPWLSDTEESHWARRLTPMAGKERGLYFLPEVDDEVLVAFEHGMMEFPYILGGLWNGVDAPPATNDDGNNNVRVLKSRSGHLIRLDDKAGEEKIEIIDSSGKNSLVLSTKDNTITIMADADITIKSKSGKLTLSGSDIDVTASGKLTLKGSEVNIN